MMTSWVRDYLLTKDDDAVEDPKQHWDIIVESYYELLDGCLAEDYKKDDEGKLIAVKKPLQPGQPGYVKLNKQNVITCADMFFEDEDPNDKNKVCATVRDGNVDNTATRKEIFNAMVKSKDAKLQDFALALRFLRLCQSGIKWIEGKGGAIKDDIGRVRNITVRHRQNMENAIDALDIDELNHAFENLPREVFDCY